MPLTFSTFCLAATSFDCQNVVIDIAMVIPTKGILGGANYATMIRSVEELIKKFSVLKDRARVGFVQFGSTAKVRLDLSDLRNPKKLSDVIMALQNENQDLGRDMNTYNALRLVSEKVFREGRKSRLSSIPFTHKPADDYHQDVIEELEVSRPKSNVMHSVIQTAINKESYCNVLIRGHPGAGRGKPGNNCGLVDFESWHWKIRSFLYIYHNDTQVKVCRICEVCYFVFPSMRCV